MLNQQHADVLAAIEASRVIGVLRQCPAVHAPTLAVAAIDAGMRAIEVTLDSERALAVIEHIRRLRPDAIVGAGTVRTAAEVREVADAGGVFVASPTTNDEVIAQANASGLLAMPGVATPTEIVHAFAVGAAVVKVFPAEQLGGPGFLAAVRAPLRHPRMIPTGGVDASNAVDYLRAGAMAVGVGGSLFTVAAVRDADSSWVAGETAALMALVAVA